MAKYNIVGVAGRTLKKTIINPLSGKLLLGGIAAKAVGSFAEHCGNLDSLSELWNNAPKETWNDYISSGLVTNFEPSETVYQILLGAGVLTIGRYLYKFAGPLVKDIFTEYIPKSRDEAIEAHDKAAKIRMLGQQHSLAVNQVENS